MKVKSPWHLIMIAVKVSAECVHCSSMARYGSQETIPFTEDMICKPQDPYGIAKYASELLVQNICEVHDLEYVISVPHNIIGPRQKYDDPYRNVASIMINLMLQDKNKGLKTQPVKKKDKELMHCDTMDNQESSHVHH